MHKNTGVKIHLSQGHPAGLSRGQLGRHRAGIFLVIIWELWAENCAPCALVVLPSQPWGSEQQQRAWQHCMASVCGVTARKQSKWGVMWCVVQSWLGQLQQEPASPSLVPKSLLLGPLTLYFETKQNTHTKKNKTKKIPTWKQPKPRVNPKYLGCKNVFSEERGGVWVLLGEAQQHPKANATGNRAKCNQLQKEQHPTKSKRPLWKRLRRKWHKINACSHSTCYAAHGCCVHWDNLKVQ